MLTRPWESNDADFPSSKLNSDLHLEQKVGSQCHSALFQGFFYPSSFPLCLLPKYILVGKGSYTFPVFLWMNEHRHRQNKHLSKRAEEIYQLVEYLMSTLSEKQERKEQRIPSLFYLKLVCWLPYLMQGALCHIKQGICLSD